MSKKHLLWAIPLALGAGLLLAGPGIAERNFNRVLMKPPYRPSARALALHRTLTIVDLHADTLLWNRDLLHRGSSGHVDVPRLVEANVAVQAFTTVTKMPRGISLDRNDGRSDSITLLTLVETWPPATWTSLKERALYQARKLDQAVGRSGGKLVMIRSASDLATYLERRRQMPGLTAAFLGVEGAHALEGDLDNVDRFYESGVRMMAPTHFFDTDIGGSAHGVEKGGLTEKGREMVKRMQARGMILDLAHASAKTLTEATALSSRPVVVSHTGVRGTCDNNRNLSDEALRAVAKTGGVVGIGVWETAVCGRDAAAIARSMRYAAGLIGVDHLGLGSDFDGAVTAPFEVTGLPLLTDALLAAGFGEDEIAKIMGGNAVRVLRQALPKE
ncbi:MAG TPA: dipeptidase [Vicinamibacteria bacterium]|nr:dipeptidase [Vicinamibacteria bacterium]